MWVEQFSFALSVLESDVKGDDDEVDLDDKEVELLIQKAMSSLLNYLQTCGVVGALILSIVVPLVISLWSPSTNSEQFWGTDGILVIVVLHRVSLLVALNFSVDLVVSSFFNFTGLSLYLTTDRQRVVFLGNFNVCAIYGYIAKCHNLIIFLVLSLPLAVQSLGRPADSCVHRCIHYNECKYCTVENSLILPRIAVPIGEGALQGALLS